MLLTKEIEVKLSNAIIKYYENKGYDIPRHINKNGRSQVKRGTTILVKTEDLSKGSNIKVDCFCDNCEKLYNMSYYDYVSKNRDGKTYCNDCCHKILTLGENHWNWNKNKTQEEREKGRKIPEYTDFVKRVMSRDNHTCQCCGQRGGELEVHHLDGYDWCIEKRTNTENGITLCSNCHSNFHSNYGYGNNTKQQFEEWFGTTIKLLENNEEIIKSRLIICLETKEIDTINFFVQKYNNEDTHIYRCCNKKAKTAKAKHYLWYNEYLNMSEDDLNEYWEWATCNNNKQIICLNNLEIFDKMTDACDKYGINSPSLLTRCCQGRNNYAGKFPGTNEKLKWMYLIDYIKLKSSLNTN